MYHYRVYSYKLQCLLLKYPEEGINTGLKREIYDYCYRDRQANSERIKFVSTVNKRHRNQLPPSPSARRMPKERLILPNTEIPEL